MFEWFVQKEIQKTKNSWLMIISLFRSRLSSRSLLWLLFIDLLPSQFHLPLSLCFCVSTVIGGVVGSYVLCRNRAWRPALPDSVACDRSFWETGDMKIFFELGLFGPFFLFMSLSVFRPGRLWAWTRIWAYIQQLL